jgi:hypothetical protein
MAKAVIRLDDRSETIDVVRDEWNEVATAVTEAVGAAVLSRPQPETITVSLAGYSWSEWNALPEDERRDLEEYGGDD